MYGKQQNLDIQAAVPSDEVGITTAEKNRPRRQCAKKHNTPMYLSTRLTCRSREKTNIFILRTRRCVCLSYCYSERMAICLQEHTQTNTARSMLNESQHRPNATQYCVLGSGYNRTGCAVSEDYRNIGTHRSTIYDQM